MPVINRFVVKTLDQDPELQDPDLDQEAMEARSGELNVKAARALTQEVGLSLRDTGELLGVSQEAVRQWVEAS